MLYQFSMHDFEVLLNYPNVTEFFQDKIGYTEFLQSVNGFEKEWDGRKVSELAINSLRALAKNRPQNLFCFRIFNGVNDQKIGRLLSGAIEELATIKDILVFPIPTLIDSQSQACARDFEGTAYDEKRKRVYFNRFLYRVVNDAHVQKLMDKVLNIFIISNDLYGDIDGTRYNWFFGQTNIVHNINYSVISLAKAKVDIQVYDLFKHELAHYFDVCENRIINTVGKHGQHCTTPLCVMQQIDTVQQAVDYAKLRYSKKADTYCKYCIEDIKRAKSIFSLKELLKLK